MLNSPPEVVIWWTLKLYFWEEVTSKYPVRVMGLVSSLLHCNASNLVLEILNHDKIWGTICIRVPQLQILGELVPFLPPAIYAHGDIDCGVISQLQTLPASRQLLTWSRSSFPAASFRPPTRSVSATSGDGSGPAIKPATVTHHARPESGTKWRLGCPLERNVLVPVLKRGESEEWTSDVKRRKDTLMEHFTFTHCL